MTDRASLRGRLTALRDEVLRRLDEAEAIDTGQLALAAQVGAVLEMLDRLPAEAEVAERAVVTDAQQVLPR